MSLKGFNKLQDDVISTGLCTACGTCVGVCPKDCLEFDLAQEAPVLTDECDSCGICYAACPGADIPLPQLDMMLFARERHVDDEPLGICLGWRKGYATDTQIRKNATSGGCTTALLVYALEKGIIDGAIVTGTDPKCPWRPEPVLATTKEEVLAAAQSKYALVPNNTLLREVERRGLNKLGIVGLPCHIEGIRKMQMYGKPKKLISRIKFTIGLFCAGNRSYKATEHVIESILGIPLDSIVKYEYRGGPESQDRMITFRDGKTEIIPKEITPYAVGIMPRDRCKECWDFSSELADVSVGDIFLPQRLGRLPNYTCMITRTEAGEALIDGTEKSGYIKTFPLVESGFSYNIGIETKKRLAARRLIDRKNEGLPVSDYHYDISHEPPPVTDVKAAILGQMKDIPEIAEWVAQSPRMQNILEGVDSEILPAMEKLRSPNEGD